VDDPGIPRLILPLTDEELVDECYRVVTCVFNYPNIVMRLGRDRLTVLVKELEHRKQMELPLEYPE
jgi:hypothetical protein